MESSAAMLFPPQFEPFQPYLAGALLQSSLTSQGIACQYMDLNLSYYQFLLSEMESGFRRQDAKPQLDLEDYKGTMKNMMSVLQKKRFGDAISSFYGLAFGDSLYSSGGVLEIAEGDWGQSFDSFLDRALTFDSNPGVWNRFVGVILVVHDQLPAATVLSKFLRKHFPETHICWGGPLISRIGPQLAQEQQLASFYDTLVNGAGEVVLPQLVRTVLAGVPYDDIPGVITSGTNMSGKIVSAPTSHHFFLPDFSGYPLDQYISPMTVLPYLTSRGCYWGKCEFCCHYRPFDKYKNLKSRRLLISLNFCPSHTM